MTADRRTFLKGLTLGSGATLLSPLLHRMGLQAAGVERAAMPHRFVFLVKSSGIIADRIEPEHVRPKLAGAEGVVEESLADGPLPETLAPLEPFKDRTAIVQGLSGKMCKGGHSSWFGAMGVYKTGGEHTSGTVLRATADAELAKLSPAPFQHVGLALRGKVMGSEYNGTLYPGITAVGPNRELPFQASPDVAHAQLFGSVVGEKDVVERRRKLDGKLLDFMVDDVKRLERTLPSSEKEKLGHYLHAFEELQVRREKLAGMSDRIEQAAPPVDDRFTTDTPEDRQAAHFDLIAAALISGITNTVTMRVDNISVNYGKLGLSEKNVHGIGHGEVCNGKTPEEARDLIRVHHVKLLAGLAAKLDAVPEGDGTMLDNTTILYFSDSGNEHHGNLEEWPYVVVGGTAGRTKLPGRYVRFPAYGRPGHATIGNWWTTWLNAFGNPVEHYGNLDLKLQQNGVPQTGAIAGLIA